MKNEKLQGWERSVALMRRFCKDEPIVLGEVSYPRIEKGGQWRSSELMAPREDAYWILGVEMTTCRWGETFNECKLIVGCNPRRTDVREVVPTMVPARQVFSVRLSALDAAIPAGLALFYGWQGPM